MEYEDFQLQIGPQVAGRYVVRVIRSPAGEGEGKLKISTTAYELGTLAGVLRDQKETPAEEDPPMVRPADIGGRLFRSVFTGQVGNLFYQSLRGMGGAGPGLRIRLRINPRDRSVTALHAVPWELLYREDTEDFLALGRYTPIVRALDVPRPTETHPLEPPLRILIVSAKSPEHDELCFVDEIGQLTEILHRNRDIRVETMEDPDAQKLRRALTGKPFHVLHYIGHGDFDPETSEGVLVIPDHLTGRETLSGPHLADKIKDLESLRLVVLNACDTARLSADSGHSPFAGVATALVLGGIPAVVAMQSPIDDHQAIAFSAAFYEQLADGCPVDEALTEGRQAIHSLDPDGAGWAVPVLFMRTPTGNLFPRRQPRPNQDPAHQRANRPAWGWIAAGVLAALVALALVFSKPEGSLEKQENGTTLEGDPHQVLAGPLPRKEAPEVGALLQADEHKASLKVKFGSEFLGFAISAADQPSLEAFISTFHREAETMAQVLAEEDLRVGGRIVHLEIGASDLTPFTAAGSVSQSCRMHVRLRDEGSGIDLGWVDARRTDVYGDAACRKASAALAEAATRELARRLREESK